MGIIYRTYEDLMDEAIAYGQERGVDTRQGSIYYDAVVGHCLRTAKFYEDLKITANQIMLDSATGDQLDQIGKEHGMERNSAIAAKWTFLCEGIEPNTGTRFLVDTMYFVLSKENGKLYLTAELSGNSGNDVAAGARAVPLVNVEGLVAANIGEIFIYGVDREGDESFRQRIREKIGGPAENGNKQHYKTWCEETPGVGRAKIFPLWAGPNTVKAVIFDVNGGPPLESLVKDVQNHVDPITKGYTVEVGGVIYTVGDGLGEGTANIGAHFLAVGASGYEINVSFLAVCKEGGTKENVETEVSEALSNEFSRLALEGEDNTEVIIRYTTIGSLISGCHSVLDYSDLKINGDTHNIAIGVDSVAILGEVAVRVGV